MALAINTNIRAINTHRQLGASDIRLARSLEKLSSGLRINRASDDAAGLSISEVLRTQVRGNLQASRNVMDAISLLNVADAGLEEIHAYLQRMRELAVQASNGSYTDADRASIDAEFQELKAGINAIALNTEYNGMTLFQGQGGTYTNVTRTTPRTATTTVNSTIQTATRNISVAAMGGTNTIPLTSAAASYNLGVPGASSIIVELRDAGGVLTRTLGPGDFTYNAGTQSVQLVGGGVPGAGETQVRVRYINESTLTQSVPAGITPGSEVVTRGTPPTTLGDAGSPAGNGYYYDPVANTVTLVGSARPAASATGAGQNFRTVALPVGDTTITLDTFTGNTFTSGAILNSLTVTSSRGGVLTEGVDFTLNETQVAQIGPTQLFQYSLTIPNSVLASFGAGAHNVSAVYNIDFPNTVDPLEIEMQIGANNGMEQLVTIDPCSAGALGLGTSNVALQPDAMNAITEIDAAIAAVSGMRAEIGAATNQMTGYFNNVTNQALQLDRAFSHIRDSDMAGEMTTLTRQQILTSSATTMLKVSQTSTQHLLSLLSAG